MIEDFLPAMLGVRREEVTETLFRRITWGVNQAGIGIPDPTHTTPSNFDTLEHYCEFLTEYLMGVEELNLRAHKNKMREGNESGRERGVYRQEGGNGFLEGNCRKEGQTEYGMRLRGWWVDHRPTQFSGWD